MWKSKLLPQKARAYASMADKNIFSFVRHVGVGSERIGMHGMFDMLPAATRYQG